MNKVEEAACIGGALALGLVAGRWIGRRSLRPRLGWRARRSATSLRYATRAASRASAASVIGEAEASDLYGYEGDYGDYLPGEEAQVDLGEGEGEEEPLAFEALTEEADLEREEPVPYIDPEDLVAFSASSDVGAEPRRHA